MKKKLLSMMLATALVTTSFVACGGSSDTAATGGDTETADAATEEEAPVELIGTSDDPNTLTVTAWDANFNIPALEAAAAAYKQQSITDMNNLITGVLSVNPSIDSKAIENLNAHIASLTAK